MGKRASAYVTADSLDASCRRWLAGIRRRVRERPGLRPDVSRCALVVVDMVRYFASPDGRSFLPAAQVVASRVRALLDAWHTARGTVVLTRHCHEGPHDLGMLGRFFRDHIRCGEPDADIIDVLRPAARDRVLRKTTYDAFHGTDLERILSDSGCDQVLVTGVLTHMCCETTVRSAFVRGLEAYVAADACASSTEELHVNALLSMADCCAVVLSAEEILAAVAGPGSRP
jgi:nicotinamidase-related amidase